MITYSALSEHSAVDGQLRRMDELALALGAEKAFVNHTHSSKSINLPVATYEWTQWGHNKKLKMMIRDNFHDINLFVTSHAVIDLPLDSFYKKHDFAWYQDNVNRKMNYCFSDWTPEELSDPRILRVKRKNGNGWSEVSPAEKDRWTARDESTAWYGKDWAGGILIPVGPIPFTEETVFYHAEHSHAEGIPEIAPPYTRPQSKFILALDSWDDLIRVSAIIVEHVKSKNLDPVK